MAELKKFSGSLWLGKICQRKSLESGGIDAKCEETRSAKLPLFRRVLRYSAPRYVGWSVGRSVGWSVGWSSFYFFGVFELFEHTAPAQMP